MVDEILGKKFLGTQNTLHFCLCSYAENSLHKQCWAIKTFEDWRLARNKKIAAKNLFHEHVLVNKLEDMGIGDMIYALIHFVHEVCKVNGSNYPSETLYSMIIMLQGFLATRGKEFYFLEDQCFKVIRNCLDNHMKLLAK